MKGHILASMAGVCGSLASLTGKLIGYRETFFQACTKIFENFMSYSFCWYSVTFVQLLFLLMTLLLNSIMWTTFVESMQFLTASEAMVINIGSNILLSAFCGWLFFAEKLSLLWWIGALLIVCGITVLLQK